MLNKRSNTAMTRLPGLIPLIFAGLVVTMLVPSILVEGSGDRETMVSKPIQAASALPPETGAVPPFQATTSGELERAVRQAAQQHHVHPALLLAVMKAESSFNPIVVSKAGAVGLMQLVPETAMRHGVQNLYDTNENVAGGARHLRYLLDRFHGNTRLALAAYNAGERKVDRYKQIPPYKETRHYVQKVLSYYRDYRREATVVPVRERVEEGYRVRTL
jgi:soluble lytic murein transglycosylase-like protein